MYICLQMFVSKIQAQEPVSLPLLMVGYKFLLKKTSFIGNRVLSFNI